MTRFRDESEFLSYYFSVLYVTCFAVFIPLLFLLIFLERRETFSSSSLSWEILVVFSQEMTHYFGLMIDKSRPGLCEEVKLGQVLK